MKTSTDILKYYEFGEQCQPFIDCFNRWYKRLGINKHMFFHRIMEYENTSLFLKIYNHIEWLQYGIYLDFRQKQKLLHYRYDPKNFLKHACVVIVGLKPYFSIADHHGLTIEKEPHEYVLQFKSALKDDIFSLSIHEIGKGNKLPWKNIVEVYD